jgi:hypothetical protein
MVLPFFSTGPGGMWESLYNFNKPCQWAILGQSTSPPRNFMLTLPFNIHSPLAYSVSDQTRIGGWQKQKEQGPDSCSNPSSDSRVIWHCESYLAPLASASLSANRNPYHNTQEYVRIIWSCTSQWSRQVLQVGPEEPAMLIFPFLIVVHKTCSCTNRHKAAGLITPPPPLSWIPDHFRRGKRI